MVIKRRTAEIATIVMSAIIVISFVALTNQFVQITSAQNKTSSGSANTTSTGSKNTTSGNQSSSSNPLANVPIIGKLFGK
ncbi:MAG: hypothetical protein JO327_09695 [Nitrososphaeraceae archaeon]|nr:hypothetical protein [Nitrososphaeraceae archaeon]MBV9668388.1 hypothetical protein [Nitrososphaeraceae archaeon]